MNARDFLGQLKKLNKQIENKQMEKEQWETIAQSTTSGGKSVLVKVKDRYELQNMERVQSSGNPQKMADAIAEVVEIQKEIDRYIMRLREKKTEIVAVIEQLDNPLHYSVLHKHYVQFKSFVEIAREEHYSYPYILEIHSNALKNVQKILKN